MAEVWVKYVFVVSVDDPDDEQEVIDAVREYVASNKQALDSPDEYDEVEP